MNVENIEIVTIIVVLLFLIPVLWNLYNSRIFKKFTYIESIKVLNKSTKIQGFVALVLIPFSWIWNKFEFIFDYLISDVYFTYVVVGIFMYLPSLAFLNLIKLIIEAKVEKRKKNNTSIITIKNETEINIPQKNICSEVIENVVIKITKPKIGKIDNANVYGYDFNGKLLWQIKDMNLVHEEHYYTSMHIINNELYLYNISGVEVKINPKTGEILSKELIK